MPAVSRVQQEAAATALAAKRGERDPRSLGPSARRMYNNMTVTQLREFAKTDTARLPERISKPKER